MTSTPAKVVKLSSLAADLNKESEGDWIPAIDIDKSVLWFVRSSNYPPFRSERDQTFAKLAAKYDGEIPDDVSARVSGELAVKHLLLGWKGLDAEYSPEKAAEVLTDESYRSVRSSIYFAATKVGRADVEFVAATAKN